MLDHIIGRAIANAGMELEEVDGIAAAAGPGLIGGVLVGLTTAKTLALVTRKPLLAINHLEAHALTARLTDNVPFPYLLLLMSGGHTQLVAVLAVGDYVRLGTTLDDAIGEAFDKVAKTLGLTYPGGPALERRAANGNPERFGFPRPMNGRAKPDFSLSGLKTAVRLEVERLPSLTASDIDDLCASFQAAVVDVVIDRTRAGLAAFGKVAGRAQILVAAGGVAANNALRRALARFAAESGLTLVVPPPALCTDNGAMIAWAGVERLGVGQSDDLTVAARPRWPLDTRGTPTVHNKA